MQQEEEAAAKEAFYKADEEEMNYVREKGAKPKLDVTVELTRDAGHAREKKRIPRWNQEFLPRYAACATSSVQHDKPVMAPPQISDTKKRKSIVPILVLMLIIIPIIIVVYLISMTAMVIMYILVGALVVPLKDVVLLPISYLNPHCQ